MGDQLIFFIEQHQQDIRYAFCLYHQDKSFTYRVWTRRLDRATLFSTNHAAMCAQRDRNIPGNINSVTHSFLDHMEEPDGKILLSDCPS